MLKRTQSAMLAMMTIIFLPQDNTTNGDVGNGEEITCRAVFSGPHVFRGFDSLCAQGFFLKPYPNWMTKAPQRGRNVAMIRKKQQQQRNDNADLMSVAGSDMTAVLR